VAIGESGEEIAQIGVRLDTVHLAGADQAGEAGPVAAALVVTCEERIATILRSQV